MPLRMLDLFCGLGGASAAMRDRGWVVDSLDIDPAFNATWTADLLTWTPPKRKYDLVWASPPCTEFSKWSMRCWYKNPASPSLALVKRCVEVVAAVQPRFWILENVQGAVQWLTPLLGAPSLVRRPINLWGKFPAVHYARRVWKEKLSSRRPADRACMPYALSLAVARSVESVLF